MIEKYYWNDKKSIQAMSSAIAQNNVVLGTTDTVIGLFASATQQGRFALDTIKNRHNKPYLLLARDIQTVLRYLAPHNKKLVEHIAHVCWPGPVTLICKAAEGVPDYLLSPEKTIAFRIPAHSGIQQLLRDHPILFSTSANKAGESIPDLFEKVDPEIVKQVVFFMHDTVPDKNAVSSTILDCSGDPIRVIRRGSFDGQLLESILGYVPR